MRLTRFFLCFAAAGLLIATLTSINQPHAIQAHADRKAEGAELFTTSGCTHCHGDALQGTSKGPTLINIRKKLNPEQMHKQIAEGGASMPAFGDSLNSGQIDALIELLRNKHPEKLLAQQAARQPAAPRQ